MSDELPPCPSCQSPFSYEMGALLVCPECAHEWTAAEPSEDSNGASHNALETDVVRDSVGNILADGDTVTVVKGMKVKGAGQLKAGTKVRNIRLVDASDGHDIDCKIDGFGPMTLKSSIVKKL